MESQGLISAYLDGFLDHADNKDLSKMYKRSRLHAYKQGWSDFISGDDADSVFERPWEETLKLIKKRK